MTTLVKDAETIPSSCGCKSNVTCKRLSDSHEGEISVTAGELGLGKLAPIKIPAGTSDVNGKTIGGLTTPEGCDTIKPIEKDRSGACGKKTVTAT